MIKQMPMADGRNASVGRATRSSEVDILLVRNGQQHEAKGVDLFEK